MSAEPEEQSVPNGDARDPSGFLSEIIGAPVTVKLNSGVVYKGMNDQVSRLTLWMVIVNADEISQASCNPWMDT